MCMSCSCRLCLWCVLCVWYFMRDVLCLQHHEICGRFVVFSLLCIKCVVFVVHRVCMRCVCSGCMWCSGCVECVCFVSRLLVCLAETVPKCACTSSGVCGCRTRGGIQPWVGFTTRLRDYILEVSNLGLYLRGCETTLLFLSPHTFQTVSHIHTLKHTYKILGQSPPSISQVQG